MGKTRVKEKVFQKGAMAARNSNRQKIRSESIYLESGSRQKSREGIGRGPTERKLEPFKMNRPFSFIEFFFFSNESRVQRCEQIFNYWKKCLKKPKIPLKYKGVRGLGGAGLGSCPLKYFTLN